MSVWYREAEDSYEKYAARDEREPDPGVPEVYEGRVTPSVPSVPPSAEPSALTQTEPPALTETEPPALTETPTEEAALDTPAEESAEPSPASVSDKQTQPRFLGEDSYEKYAERDEREPDPGILEIYVRTDVAEAPAPPKEETVAETEAPIEAEAVTETETPEPIEETAAETEAPAPREAATSFARPAPAACSAMMRRPARMAARAPFSKK